MTGLSNFIAELKRRGVFRVAVAYAVTAWVITEVAVSIEEPLHLPGWFDTSIIVVIALGFPIALLLAYAYDLTPEGIKHDDGSGIDPHQFSGYQMTAFGLVLALVFSIIGWQFLSTEDVSEPVAEQLVVEFPITDVSKPVAGYDGREAIAVLPFLNLSEDADQGYLADGITEDIITELYSFQTFPVIARTSTFRYKEQSKDVREIATELGAGYILEGSVRRISDRVRITAQLIDANGEHLWAEKYDVLWSEVLNVHDEIIYSIVEAIEPELILSETKRRRHVGTEDLVAWDYYLRARALSGEEFSTMTLSGVPVTLETNDQAWRLANKALETAQDFSGLYALLSHIDGVSVLFLAAELDPEDVMFRLNRGLKNATRARTLDPFEATACACQIVLLLVKGDVEGAVETGESALEQNPGSAFILAGLAKALQVSGNNTRALELIQKAKRLSPRGISMATYLGFESLIRQSMGDMAGAGRVAREAQRLNPRRTDIMIVRLTSLLAEGRRDEALKVMAEIRLVAPFYRAGGIWPEPFPQTIIEGLDEPLRSELAGKSYAEGILIVLEDLGWKDPGKSA